ncbi:TetR family transcriptional regulator [Desulfobotulus alkaliphilus]|uniref:TetR family transcriptional regulator n=1 Tax=Desulfobotulus alkaliphilus TaxID=622671 RepID=A0A562R9M8_9BACT|nr:TetR/AcrR family transcriptional regulator [Desulfobotulus alkaliphilus]TWI65781.1 TetR family transcriptional regulator [Desulfobotulus alkaliphilus]
MASVDKPRGLARENILDSATRLFLDKGIDKASLSDIAAAAGVSKGTLHYHFASKNDLIFHITETHMKAITDELLSLLNRMKKCPDRLFSVLMSSLLEAKGRGRLHLHLVREAVAGNPELRSKIAGSYKGWEGLLQDSLCQLFPGHRAPAFAAQLIIAIIDGFIIQDLVRKEEVDFTPLVEALMALNAFFSDKQDGVS